MGDMSIDFNQIGHPKFRSSMMPDPAPIRGPNLNSTEHILDCSYSRSVDGLRTPDLSVLHEHKSDPNDVVQLYTQVSVFLLIFNLLKFQFQIRDLNDRIREGKEELESVKREKTELIEKNKELEEQVCSQFTELNRLTNVC